MKAFAAAVLLLAQSPHHTVEILSFTATPTTIATGATATLEWKTRGVDSVTVDSGRNAGPARKLPPSGKLEVQPRATTVYTLHCEANGDYCAPLTVTVRVTP